MTIHDWALFADIVLKAIDHPDIPVTNKEARLKDSVIHAAGNWVAEPKAHGIEAELPLKKLHHCTDIEQILHIIQKSLPDISEVTLEGALRKIQELAHKGEKKPARAGPIHTPRDIEHDRDVIMGFLQSAIGQVGKLKDISNESRNTTISMLREACQKVRETSSPVAFLSSVENTLHNCLAKEEKKYRSFLTWFHTTVAGVERKVT